MAPNDDFERGYDFGRGFFWGAFRARLEILGWAFLFALAAGAVLLMAQNWPDIYHLPGPPATASTEHR